MLHLSPYVAILAHISGRTGHSEIPVIVHCDIANTTAKGKANVVVVVVVVCQAFADRYHPLDADDQPEKVREFPRTMLEKVIL